MPDFERTLNAALSNEVTPTSVKQDGETLTTEPLEVVVTGPGDANRLLIFSGIAIVSIDFVRLDEILRRGSVLVRLNYQLPSAVKFLSSSTTAALASIFNGTGESFTFAVVDAFTEPQSVDPNNPQSAFELVLTAHLAVQGRVTGISAMAYQVHVLVRDTSPELESILVRRQGDAVPFGPSTVVAAGGSWEYQITLTGPVVKPTELILVSSSNPAHIPIGPPAVNNLGAAQLFKDQVSAVFAAPPTVASGSLSETAIITASFTRQDQSVVQKTATVHISELK